MVTKIIKCFDGKDRDDMSSGVVSQMSWSNKDVMIGLRKMFGCRSNEKIVAVELSNQTIRVEIETEN